MSPTDGGTVAAILTTKQRDDLRRWLVAALGDGVSLRQEAANEGRRVIAALGAALSTAAPAQDHRLTDDDVEVLAEELWANSASPGASPTDAHRDLARLFLTSDWLAARAALSTAAPAQAWRPEPATLRWAADRWVSDAINATAMRDLADRIERDRAERLAEPTTDGA